jgi:CHASE3 domain sensor protein
MKIKSSFNRKLVFAFAPAIVVLLVVGAFSYRGMVVSSESDQWVRHSHEVLGNLQELLFAVASIESSSRGFVLTGEDSYLASDDANISSADQHLAAVRKLTTDNPDQQRQLAALERLVAQKIQFAEEAINLRRAKGLEAGSDAIQSGQGQRAMDEFGTHESHRRRRHGPRSSPGRRQSR